VVDNSISCVPKVAPLRAADPEWTVTLLDVVKGELMALRAGDAAA
jgi:hypothetical protein